MKPKLVCMYSEVYLFFNDTAPTEIFTLSVHDARPIFTETWSELNPDASAPILISPSSGRDVSFERSRSDSASRSASLATDRKSTRLNSSHANISYAVICLKKKLTRLQTPQHHNRPVFH